MGLINFLRGYIIIEAYGFFIERFINLCINTGIYLWGIKRIDKNKVLICVSRKGFELMGAASEKTGTTVKILKKKGLPFFIEKHRRRKGFLLGLAAFIFIIITLTSFIWSIEITGLSKVDEKTVRNALSSCGVEIGVLKYNKNITEIKREMLIQVPELSWVWVYIRGTKAFVSVKERTLEPDIIPENVACNIVALRDGVIEDYTVLEGKPQIKIGDVVQKNALLVSGVIDQKYGGSRLVHSSAEIIAKTWYEESRDYPLYKEERKVTGNKKKRYKIALGEKDIPLFFGEESPYKDFDKKENVTQIKLWGDLYLPFTFKSAELSEISVVRTNLTENEATEYYKTILFEEMKEKLREGITIKNINVTNILTDGNKLRITCVLECSEEIGAEKIIEENEID